VCRVWNSIAYGPDCVNVGQTTDSRCAMGFDGEQSPGRASNRFASRLLVMACGPRLCTYSTRQQRARCVNVLVCLADYRTVQQLRQRWKQKLESSSSEVTLLAEDDGRRDERVTADDDGGLQPCKQEVLTSRPAKQSAQARSRALPLVAI